jgi:EAL domain-containing protein (putative c-di-GMP-specific phosphodiesterase class I)
MATAEITPELQTRSAWEIRYDAPPERQMDPSGGRGGVTFADIFVGIAVTLATIALAVGLLAETNVPVMVAVFGAGCAWLAMLIGHRALRRAERAPRQADDYVTDGDDHATDLATDWADDWTEDRTGGRVDDRAKAQFDAEQMPAAGPAYAAREEVRDRHANAPEFGKRKAPATHGTATATAKGEPDNNFLMDLDLGDFRPKAEPELPREAGDVARPSLDRRLMAGAPGESADVNKVLQRLAEDIKKGRKGGGAADSDAMATRTEPKLPVGMTAAAEALRAGDLPRTAAGREAKGAKPPPLPPAFPPKPMAAPPEAMELPPTAMPVAKERTAATRLAAVADALASEDMDVFLETINGLDDFRARHYQVSVRLRLADGETLDSERMVSETRGSGLLPLIEAVKVSSAKRVAVQMIRRGRSGDFFSLVDGEALQTGQFSGDMETIVGGDETLASRLVLAFSQSDVRGFAPAQWDSLREIANLGFRFSIEDITDLDMDFEKLGSNGFAFAKLDAEVFLSGLPIESGHLPAADICRYLSGAGLALIVGRIVDETTRAKIMGFGALYGQGTLFGGPRPVRSDVLREPEAQTTAG